MFKRTTVIATGLLLTATGIAAQAGHMHEQRSDTTPGMTGQRMMTGGMMGQGMMGAGMMGMMGSGMGMMATGGPGPAMILRMGETLELSDEQVSSLNDIRDELASVKGKHMKAAMAAHREAAQALDGDASDFAAYEAALSEGASHMVRAHVAMARASVQAREVLDPEQRAKMESGMRMMRRMMRNPSGADGRMTHRHETTR